MGCQGRIGRVIFTSYVPFEGVVRDGWYSTECHRLTPSQLISRGWCQRFPGIAPDPIWEVVIKKRRVSENNDTGEAKTVILTCTCNHDFQDRTYGKHKRLFNRKYGAGGGWRCTVCGVSRT